MKSGSLRRKTPLRQQTPLQRAGIKPYRPKAKNDFSAEVRDEVRRRSGGRCEFPGCPAPAVHMHHRQSRRAGDHSATNAMHLCNAHHIYIHSHSAESYENGWMVRVNSAG